MSLAAQDGPSITADGSTIAFEAYEDDTGADYDIHVMGSDGTGLTRPNLTWATRPSANSHNVYRAAWSSPGAVPPASSGDCLRSGVPGTSAPVGDDPPLAQAYGFFVTGENGWGEGTEGLTAQGVERIPATSYRSREHSPPPARPRAHARAGSTSLMMMAGGAARWRLTVHWAAALRTASR